MSGGVHTTNIAPTDCAYSCVLSDKHKYSDKSGVLRPQVESQILETRLKTSRHVRCFLHGDNMCLQARCIFIELPHLPHNPPVGIYENYPFHSVLCGSATIDVY